ncbi:hypothetical protein B484DRAFT_407544, partial [Ochromonadaceae sp. CCMP2298]
MQRTDSHQNMNPAANPVAKRVSRLRTLVSFLLVVAAVAVGVGSYMGVRFQERHNAVSRFKSRVKAAEAKLDANLKNMDNVMILIAQNSQISGANWPIVALPDFYEAMPLVRDIGGSDNVALVTHVKPADLASYEAFMFGYWDAEPHIPPDHKPGYYSAA